MSAPTSGSVPNTLTQEVLTLPEAAAYLRVPEDALRQMAEADAIPVRKIGTEWRFLRAALKAWLRRDAGAPERSARCVASTPLAVWEPLLAELDRRFGIPAAPSGKPGKEEVKRRILEVAGVWKDDPTVDELLREIYRQRGRPMVEGEE